MFKKKAENDEFTSLAKIIIGQQLSSSAAKTITGRLEKVFSSKKFYPNIIITTDDHLFRECGMSYSKINYIKGIAKLVSNQKNYFKNLKKMTDSEIIEALCSIKGVGVWTA